MCLMTQRHLFSDTFLKMKSWGSAGNMKHMSQYESRLFLPHVRHSSLTGNMSLISEGSSPEIIAYSLHPAELSYAHLPRIILKWVLYKQLVPPTKGIHLEWISESICNDTEDLRQWRSMFLCLRWNKDCFRLWAPRRQGLNLPSST
jgi:hypothetical protein